MRRLAVQVCGCNAAVKLLLSTGPQPLSEHPTQKTASSSSTPPGKTKQKSTGRILRFGLTSKGTSSLSPLVLS